MREIEKIVLHVAANTLNRITTRGRSDNYEDSPYYNGLTKEEKKMLSDYLVNKHIEDWDYMDDDQEKTMYNKENIYDYLVQELREIAEK